MDLYPELAVSLREIRSGLLPSLLQKAMGWAYRRARTVVVLDDDMAARLRAYGVWPEVIRPWVSAATVEAVSRATAEPESPWTWLYSGNLGRAHEWETLLAAQAILEERGAGIRLVFQGGGPARPAAEAKGAELGLRECVWKGYLDGPEVPDALRRAQVLVVTQLPSAQGLLWPSKLALLLCLPRPILWVGPTEGAIARDLRLLPQAGVFAPSQAAPVADWLMALKSQAEPPTRTPIDPAAQRSGDLGKWRQFVENCH